MSHPNQQQQQTQIKKLEEQLSKTKDKGLASAIKQKLETLKTNKPVNK